MTRAQFKKTARLFHDACAECLRPPEELTVSQWAERNREMGKSSALPGRWQNSVTPYLCGIMDEFNNPYTREIVFCKPTQVGGTEALLNIIGYVAMTEGASTIIVEPSDAMAKRFSKNRLQDMIDRSDGLKKAYHDRGSRTLEKQFDGMTLYIVGSRSPSNLASSACKYVLLDESDKHIGASAKEADAFSLVRERTKTFPFTYKIYDNCTPTLESGHIWQALKSCDVERHYYVPCPNCGVYIEFKFKQIKFDKADGMSVIERADTAMYFCQECGEAIDDMHKPSMLRAGRWENTVGMTTGTKTPEKVGFWLNTLYSPFVSWSKIAREWLECRHDMEKRQNFINSWLAEPWKDTKLATDSDVVLNKKTAYPQNVVPNWAKLLTGGVDVQHGSLYWVIRAWGEHMTSMCIAYGQAMDFQEVADVMNLEYPIEGGSDKMLVDRALIDSGDQTDMVYEFCLENQDWAMPSKGASHSFLGNYKHTIINKTGSKAAGMTLILVSGDKYKDMIAARMLKPNGIGAWMVHSETDGEYAAQVTAEEKAQIKTPNGSALKWIPKRSHAANHYLDAEVYAFAAADMLGVRGLHLDKTEERGQVAVNQNDWVNAGSSWL